MVGDGTLYELNKCGDFTDLDAPGAAKTLLAAAAQGHKRIQNPINQRVIAGWHCVQRGGHPLFCQPLKIRYVFSIFELPDRNFNRFFISSS